MTGSDHSGRMALTVGIMSHPDYIAEIVSLLGEKNSNGIAKIKKMFNGKPVEITVSSSIAPLLKTDYTFMIGTAICDKKETHPGDIIFVDNAFFDNGSTVLDASVDNQMKSKITPCRPNSLTGYVDQLCGPVKYNPHAMKIIILNKLTKCSVQEVMDMDSIAGVSVTRDEVSSMVNTLRDEKLIDDSDRITNDGNKLLEIHDQNRYLHWFSYTDHSFVTQKIFPIKFSNVLSVDSLENTSVKKSVNAVNSLRGNMFNSLSGVHAIDTSSFHFLNACKADRSYIIKVAVSREKNTPVVIRHSLQFALAPVLWFCDKQTQS